MVNVAGVDEAATGLPADGSTRDQSQTHIPGATGISMNSASSAITCPLDALAIACAHHEKGERPALSTTDVSATASVIPATAHDDVVSKQNTTTPKTDRPDRKQKAKYERITVINSAISEVPSASTSEKAKYERITFINSAISEVPSASTSEFKITNNDVLCGRGGLTNHHPGNVLFRGLVRAKQEEYLRATKREKSGVAKEIVDVMRKLDPPGRFLKKDPKNPGKWMDIGDRKAREKTSQALRENAPELREELSTTPTTRSGNNTKQTSASVGGIIAPSLLAATTSITIDEQQQALQATRGSTPRGRVVSSDSANGSGWTPTNLAQYQQNAASSKQHMVVDDGATTANVITPLSLTPSSSSSSADDTMDTSSNASIDGGDGGYSGSKRKIDDQEMQEQQDSPKKSSRGPRMKLLKARMADLCR